MRVTQSSWAKIRQVRKRCFTGDSLGRLIAEAAQTRKLRRRTEEEIHRVVPAFVPKASLELDYPDNVRNSQDGDYNEDEWESEDDTEQQALLRRKRGRHNTATSEKYGGPGRIPVHVTSDVASTTIESLAPEGLNEEQLIQKVHHLQEQLAAGRQELERTKYELGLERSKRANYLDDKYFSSAVLSLRSKIRQWATAHFENQAGYVTRRAANHFKHLTSNFTAYLQSKEHRPWLIQARLWDLLQLRIFDQSSPKRHGYIWTGRAKSQQLDTTLREGSCLSTKQH